MSRGPHEKRGPGRETATMERRKASAGAFLRRGRMMLRRAALHPPRLSGEAERTTSRRTLRRGYRRLPIPQHRTLR
jgi:hypothetical protein